MAAFPHLPAQTWDAFLAGELPGPAESRVEAHLDGCAECRRHLEIVDPSRIFRRLRSSPSAPASWDGFWEGIEPALAVRASSRTRLGALAGIAAAILTLLALRGATWRSHPEAPLPPALAPCDQPQLATLHLTQAECRALFARPLTGTAEQVVVVPNLDLRGL